MERDIQVKCMCIFLQVGCSNFGMSWVLKYLQNMRFFLGGGGTQISSFLNPESALKDVEYIRMMIYIALEVCPKAKRVMAVHLRATNSGQLSKLQICRQNCVIYEQWWLGLMMRMIDKSLKISYVSMCVICTYKQSMSRH